jgi:hypothetical protein
MDGLGDLGDLMGMLGSISGRKPDTHCFQVVTVLIRAPRATHGALALVCKRFRATLRSKDFLRARKKCPLTGESCLERMIVFCGGSKYSFAKTHGETFFVGAAGISSFAMATISTRSSSGPVLRLASTSRPRRGRWRRRPTAARFPCSR